MKKENQSWKCMQFKEKTSLKGKITIFGVIVGKIKVSLSYLVVTLEGRYRGAPKGIFTFLIFIFYF
jgi:hypothetical protein